MAKVSDIKDAAVRLIDTLSGAQPLRKALESIDSCYEFFAGAAAREGQGHSHENFNRLQSSADSALKALNSLAPNQLYGDLRELRRRLEEPGEYAPLLSVAAQAALLKKVEQFTETLDAFFQTDKSKEQTLLLVVSAHELITAIDIMEPIAITLREALDARTGLPPTMDRLELTFDSAPTVPNIQSKLTIIAEMYAEAGAIVVDADIGGDVGSPESLTVYRMEEGTTIMELIGTLSQIGMVAWAFRAAARFGYRHYTREGRLAGFREEKAAFNDLVELQDMMKSRGLPIQPSSEKIQEAGKRLVQKACDLLTSEAVFMLDGVEFVRSDISVTLRHLPTPIEIRRLGPGDPPSASEPDDSSDGEARPRRRRPKPRR